MISAETQTCLLDGNVEQALESISAGPAGDLQYWWICSWLASAGFIGEAEAHIRKAREELAGKLLLRLWTAFAVLDPRIVPELRVLVTRPSNLDEARKALRLIYFIEGTTDALFAAYAGTLENFSGSARQREGINTDMMSLAVHAKRLELLDADVSLHPNRLSIHLERYFLQHGAGEKCPKFHEERSRRFTTSIDQATRDIWSHIGDQKLRVAVVGNSPVEVSRGKGPEIDDHDIVIRFNVPSPSLHEDYGQKTDVMVINHSILKRTDIARLQGQNLLMTGPDWETFTVNRRAAAKMIRRGNKIGMIKQGIRRSLTDKLLATASSGLQVSAAVLDSRGSTENVNFYGFSMIDQIGQRPTSANYFRRSRPVFRHNWIGEAAIFDAVKSAKPWPDVGHTRYANHWGARDQFRPKRFCLLGDHTDYHCGSAAVTRHIKDCFAPLGVWVTEVGDCDTLIVNGEGSMHHDSPAYLEKMSAIQKAQAAGKETMLINSVWQKNAGTFDDTLRKIDKICVRESMSALDLEERHGVTASVYPDFAYFSRLDDKPAITNFGGNLVATDVYSHEFKTFVRWTGKKDAKFTYVDMALFTWSDLVASLKTAELLVTGRQHAVFAACRAEIPFIAFPGNTHKVEGVLKAAKVEIPICNDKRELNSLIRWARKNPEPYQKLFKWLRSHPTWTPDI